jgi:hypothetical protein
MNQQIRDSKTASVNPRTTESKDSTVETAHLTQDIVDLVAAIKDLEADIAKATEDCSRSKAMNEQMVIPKRRHAMGATLC